MNLNPSFHIPPEHVGVIAGAVVGASIAALVVFGIVIGVMALHRAPKVDGSLLVYLAFVVGTIYETNRRLKTQEAKLIQSIKSGEVSNWQEAVTESYFWRTCGLCLAVGGIGAVLGIVSVIDSALCSPLSSLLAMLLPVAYLAFIFPTQARYLSWAERILRDASSGADS